MPIMLIRPLNNVLIVEPDPVIKHEGLIVLPDKNTEEKISPFATVVSWGPGCRYSFKKDQRIIMDRFRGTPFNFIYNEKKYRFITEDDIHAVIE